MSAIVAVTAFPGVMIGLFAASAAAIVTLGACSPRSAAEHLDRKPARPDGGAIPSEDDEAEPLLAPQSVLRRRRGLPQPTREDVDAELRRARAELGARADGRERGGRDAWPAS